MRSVALALLSALVLIPVAEPACAQAQESGRDLLRIAPARNADGSVNAVIEIPAGTNDKWQVEDSGALEWELEDGRPRVVQYLAYPANYGMVPGTLQAASSGGDGDPLDIVVLGPAVPRGQVVQVRPIAVLRLTDKAERDDKLVAVRPGEPLGDVENLTQLDDRYPGVSSILELWFTGYKGPGRIESGGYADRAEALRILDRAVEAFERARPVP